MLKTLWQRFRSWRLLTALFLAVAGLQWFVIGEIERQVLEPVNRPQGGLSVADDFSAGTRQLDAEAYDGKWFSSHHAVDVSNPSATLHVWRFDPWHNEHGETDHDARATVLLIPGWGGSAMNSQYLYPLALLCRAEGCRVFFVDLRGQGCASGDTCSYGYLDARDLAQLADSLRKRNQVVGPVLLAGHSYGALAAIQAAPVVPEVIGVMAFSGPKDLYAVAATSRRLASRTYPWLYPLARPFLSDAAFRFAVEKAANRHGFEADQSSALLALQHHGGPVLIAHGEQDLDVPVSNARALHQARPEMTELHLFPGADHWSYLGDEKSLGKVRAWLKGVLASSGPAPGSGSTESGR